MNKLILVRGLPGSGKSTFANWLGCFHVENDYFHIHDGKYVFDEKQQGAAVQWCIDTAREMLSRGLDVVVSNTFTKQRYIDTYKAVAEVFGAKFEVYHMMGTFENKHSVPDNVKKSMADGWEPWDGEMFVYPNINQDPQDPCFRPYMLTKLAVGDHVLAKRWAGGKHLAILGEPIEFEEAEAIVTEIRQGTYDYLNVFYKFIDTGDEALAMSGDLKKAAC